ncbi:MAG: hypothetical protein AAF722_11110 [Cyanobacteria bacterium P01_C01_bin.70]
MIRLGMALTALVSTVAIAPYVDAAPKTDSLNLITLKPEIISVDLLSSAPSAANPSVASESAPADVEATRRERLDQAASELNQQVPENPSEAARSELVIIEF